MNPNLTIYTLCKQYGITGLDQLKALTGRDIAELVDWKQNDFCFFMVVLLGAAEFKKKLGLRPSQDFKKIKTH